jgi:uncharacterized protein
MGILLMNIQSFAMPEAAYVNPAAYGGSHGADLATWVAELILVDGKMRGLFSWLFGASLLLVTDRAGARAAVVHYRRMAWLFVFGLAHFVLVWDGDILMHYALLGCLAFWWRRRAPHELIAAAIALLVVQLLLDAGTPIAADQLAAAAARAHPDAATLRGLADLRNSFGIPAPATIAAEIARHRGGWVGLIGYRVGELARVVGGTLGAVGLETLAYMLLGMAGLRGGFLTGAWPRAAYRRVALYGLGGGGLGFALLAAWIVATGFDFRNILWQMLVWSVPLRPPMIAGWAALVLLARSGALTARIAAAGRMAFSNYLGTSIVCAALFDGAGWFGRLSRADLLAIVLAIWATMLIWSPAWLARFRYGPLEWCWRSLARWQRQPLLR